VRGQSDAIDQTDVARLADRVCGQCWQTQIFAENLNPTFSWEFL
jgi:hypothetical protein